MEIFIAIGIGLVLFLVMFMAVPKLVTSRSEARTRDILERMTSNESGYTTPAPSNADADSDFAAELTGFAKLFVQLPGGRTFYTTMVQSGYSNETQKVMLGVILLFVVSATLFFKLMGAAGLILALAVSYYVPYKYFLHKIQQRNDKFIEMFPEAIDMIVRSVKSGHPLNSAMRMIADNMESPMREEFRQVNNEIAYGRPLVEALKRLSKRINEPDVHFFVVVLSVQQETGGNLAEILGNLSNVIRGRKKLKQKIKALTSEGRATAWILGLLPVMQFLAIYLTSPDYLDPLFETALGMGILVMATTLILLAVWIVKQMIDIDI